MAARWTASACALCGVGGGRTVLAVPHPDAPGGTSRVVACPRCGLRRLDPRPDERAVAAYYDAVVHFNAYAGRRRGRVKQALWDALRDGYAAPSGLRLAGRLARPLTRRLAAWLFDVNVPLDGRRGLRVLDVGSGYGDLLLYLRSRGCIVVGTDPSARATARARDYGLDVRTGTLAALGLPAGSFDVVVMSHSLEHVPDPNVELAEAARVLAPDGRLHLAMPNGDAVRLRLDGSSWAHLSHPLHFWFFDRRTAVALLARHGFRPVVPPRTTTRHHALLSWSQRRRAAGAVVATWELARFAGETLRTPAGGDVLRIVAARAA